MNVLISLLFLAASAASVLTQSPGLVRPGIEVFLSDVPPQLRGKRVGLITNHAAVDRSGTLGIDLIARHKDLKLVALFAAEHGIRGDVAAGAKIVDDRDATTGVPIFSTWRRTAVRPRKC